APTMPPCPASARRWTPSRPPSTRAWPTTVPEPERMPRRFHLMATLILAAATTAPASAQVTLYRCTDPAGQLTVQNQPCPPGSSQREQSVGGVSSTPEPAPDRPAPIAGAAAQPMDPAAARGNDEGFRLWDSASLASERALAEAAAAVAPRPPPPPLYRCSSRAGDHYLSETSEPAPQCIALRTAGRAVRGGARLLRRATIDRTLRALSIPPPPGPAPLALGPAGQRAAASRRIRAHRRVRHHPLRRLSRLSRTGPRSRPPAAGTERT